MKTLFDNGVDLFSTLAGIHFHNLVLALEHLQGGQGFRLKRFESQRHALDIVITAARVLGTTVLVGAICNQQVR